MFHKHDYAFINARYVEQYRDWSYGNGGPEEYTGTHTYIETVCTKCTKVKTIVLEAKVDKETLKAYVTSKGLVRDYTVFFVA